MSDLALSIAYAILFIDDAEVESERRAMHSQSSDSWHWALQIADIGPRNDMERRIMAHAMVRRLEGK